MLSQVAMLPCYEPCRIFPLEPAAALLKGPIPSTTTARYSEEGMGPITRNDGREMPGNFPISPVRTATGRPQLEPDVMKAYANEERGGSDAEEYIIARVC
ncbi:hypothetical protein GWI33_007503 [Rhynchophorus ferrugineus]|uniref:Uncharacterized protein n=1 Tax=Rhynchophorus ferrugineus TaxID=354439 RepID=A0A834MC20_RHYFE|nr:hypothetical protein GWI33_007503 [Rhynchophorus ferrugineus]